MTVFFALCRITARSVHTHHLAHRHASTCLRLRTAPRAGISLALLLFLNSSLVPARARRAPQILPGYIAAAHRHPRLRLVFTVPSLAVTHLRGSVHTFIVAHGSFCLLRLVLRARFLSRALGLSPIFLTRVSACCAHWRGADTLRRDGGAATCRTQHNITLRFTHRQFLHTHTSRAAGIYSLHYVYCTSSFMPVHSPL